MTHDEFKKQRWHCVTYAKPRSPEMVSHIIETWNAHSIKEAARLLGYPPRSLATIICSLRHTTDVFIANKIKPSKERLAAREAKIAAKLAAKEARLAKRLTRLKPLLEIWNQATSAGEAARLMGIRPQRMYRELRRMQKLGLPVKHYQHFRTVKAGEDWTSTLPKKSNLTPEEFQALKGTCRRVVHTPDMLRYIIEVWNIHTPREAAKLLGYSTQGLISLVSEMRLHYRGIKPGTWTRYHGQLIVYKQVWDEGNTLWPRISVHRTLGDCLQFRGWHIARTPGATPISEPSQSTMTNSAWLASKQHDPAVGDWVWDSCKG